LNKVGGHFILKMFDLHTDSSIHLLYMLSLFYDEIFIYKPFTSRPTNSEKYIICKGYHETSFLESAIGILQEINKNTTKCHFFKIFTNIPKDFLKLINDINKEFLNNQILALEKYINLCDNKRKHSCVDKNIAFYEWSRRFNFS
jgi:cap1 methyltransferase